MSNVQLENGFTRIANELLEVIQQYKFSLNELKIILCVFRFTYGFNRKEHEMSLTFFMNHTGLNRSRVNSSLKSLIENNVLIVTKKGNAKTSNTYMFNKNYNTWKIEKYSSFTSGKTDTSVQIDTSIKTDTSTSVQNDTRPSVQIDTQEINNKEILKKEDEEETNPVELYERNFFPLTPMQIESIWDWVDDFKGNQEVICMAIKETALKNPSSPFKYLTRILVDWHKRKLFTLEDVLKAKEQYEKSKVIHLERKKQKQEQPQGRYIPKDAVVDINAGEDPNWTWKKPF